jgi:hypothetical protein
VFLIQNADVLPHLYTQGYSAIADASKHFYKFKTRKEERLYLGCIHHPTKGAFLVDVGFPMGGGKSPAIACPVSNRTTRMLHKESPAFQGKVIENMWPSSLEGHPYHPEWGHGCVWVALDGLPVHLIWGMVDDFKTHQPTKAMCGEGFSVLMHQTPG